MIENNSYNWTVRIIVHLIELNELFGIGISAYCVSYSELMDFDKNSIDYIEHLEMGLTVAYLDCCKYISNKIIWMPEFYGNVLLLTWTFNVYLFFFLNRNEYFFFLSLAAIS